MTKQQPLTNDMTKGKYTGLYQLGVNSFFVPNTNPFNIQKMSIYPHVIEHV